MSRWTLAGDWRLPVCNTRPSLSRRALQRSPGKTAPKEKKGVKIYFMNSDYATVRSGRTIYSFLIISKMAHATCPLSQLNWITTSTIHSFKAREQNGRQGFLMLHLTALEWGKGSDGVGGEEHANVSGQGTSRLSDSTWLQSNNTHRLATLHAEHTATIWNWFFGTIKIKF